VLGQDPLGFHRGGEDVQPVLQRRGRGIVMTGLGDLHHGRRDPFGGVGDDELQVLKGLELVRPRLGLAVDRVVTEDGRQARRLDPDQGRSPPKKISSTASERTLGMHATSSALRTGWAVLAASATQRPMVL
jgi:hypothetical protein